MDGNLILWFVICALVLFLVLSGAKFLKYSKWSTHGRFDLYPVPKEGDGRAEYGGSLYEQDKWWEKERHVNRAAEMIDVMKEMLYIRKLFTNQRSLWFPSMLFHGGIYVMMGWSVCLIISGITQVDWVIAVVNVIGIIGFACATIGAAWLLIKRLAEVDLRNYTTPQEYFNLIAILVVLITGIFSWTTLGAGCNPNSVAGMLFGSVKPEPLPALVVCHLVLMSLLMIYIPVSKMGHYAGKFFAFRSVFWNNDPNLAGSVVDQKMRAAAAQPVSTKWSAPHAQPAPAKEAEE